jgi:hypothetical protein
MIKFAHFFYKNCTFLKKKEKSLKQNNYVITKHNNLKNKECSSSFFLFKKLKFKSNFSAFKD